MKKVMVGIIGCGTIANSAHIPAYLKNEDVEIKYFCDIIPERAKAAVEKYGCGIAVEDYHKVLEDPEVEAISVCTPNRMHAIIAIDAMRAGKHVLCEKPAARTYPEALEMQKVQHETGMTLNIGVVNRFNDMVNLICIGAVGFFASSVFSIIYSMALQARPEKANQISGLMITAVAGGGGVTPVIGFAIGTVGVIGGVFVTLACVCYLTYCAFGVKTAKA